MADVVGYFPATLAVDSSTGTRLRNVTAKVYAITDTNFTTPLAVTDMADVPFTGNEIASNSDGIFPEFKAPEGVTQVILKSGQALTPMTSVSAAVSAANAAAAAAGQAASDASSASANAETAVQTAEAARVSAQQAAAAAAAVGATTDLQIASRIGDPASQTYQTLMPVIDAGLDTVQDAIDLRRFYKWKAKPGDADYLSDAAIESLIANAQQAFPGQRIYLHSNREYPAEIVAGETGDLLLRGDGSTVLVQKKNRGIIRMDALPEATPRPISRIDSVLIQNTDDGNIIIGRAINCAASDMLDMRVNDPFLIVSDDNYEGAYTPGSSGKPIKTGWFRAHAFLYNIDITGAPGTLTANTVIIGSTSGARAPIGAVATHVLTSYEGITVADDDNGKAAVVFYQNATDAAGAPKAFIPGETLTVGGVVVGTLHGPGRVFTTAPLKHKYVTNVRMHKGSDRKFEMEGFVLRAEGDPYELMDTNLRRDAIRLRGVVAPKIRDVRVASGYYAGLSVWSVFDQDIDMTIDMLPNIPGSDGFRALGYGYIAYGSTEGGVVRMRGGNCRHLVTTGSINRATPLGSDLIETLRAGVPKNILFTGDAWNTMGAPWDNHAGAIDLLYKGCTARSAASGARETPSAAYNNRAHGSIYEDCSYDGTFIDGWMDSSGSIVASFENTVILRSCRGSGHFRYAFRHGSNLNVAPGPSTRFSIDLDAEPSPLLAGMPIEQALMFLGAWETTVHTPRSVGTNAAGIVIGASMPACRIIGGVFDMSRGGAQTVIDVKTAYTTGRIAVGSLTVLTSSDGASPASIMRSRVTGTVNVRFGSIDVFGNDTRRPFLLSGRANWNVRNSKNQGASHSTTGQSWDPPAIAPGASTTKSVTVTGVTTDMWAWAILGLTLPEGVDLSAEVSAADTIRFTLTNNTGVTQDIAATTVSGYAIRL